MPRSIRIPAFATLVIVAATLVALRVRTAPAPAERSYVGQGSCVGCHADAYSPTSDYRGAAAFRGTLHQKIHLRPNPETVVMERYFAGDSVLRFVVRSIPIVGLDTLMVALGKSDDGREYYAQMRFSGEGGDTTPRMKIAYTYGGYGWMQRYLVEIDGSFYVLPFQFVLPAYKERSDTANAFYWLDLTRWFELDPQTSTGRFYRFGTNRFREQSWDRNCSFCHVNGFSLARRITGGGDTAFLAHWTGRGDDSLVQDENILIGCESCHGPGSEHAANPTATNIFSPGRLPRTREATDLKIDVCNACHTRARSTPGGLYPYPYDETADRPWVPGGSVRALVRNPFTDAQYWGDKATSFAHHQSGQDFWRGAPYEKHVFVDGCWDCHAVHTEGPNGLPYQLKRNYYSLDDGVGCLECHGSSGPTRVPALEDMSQTTLRNGRLVNAHTRHEAASSACVNCHFTKAATLTFTNLPRKPIFEFSQHDFRVVRPIATREFANGFAKGMINTCAASCHRNGRGSRNTPDSLPAAPDYGIRDQIVDVWREQSDYDLADSLWYHYQRMYPEYVSSVREDASRGAALAIVSITPNPVSATATIRYTLPRRGDVRLSVHDARGALVRLLASGSHDDGAWREHWSTTDELGNPVPSGRYLLRLEAGGKVVSEMVTVVR